MVKAFAYIVSAEGNTPDLIPNSSYQRTSPFVKLPGYNDLLPPQLFMILVLRMISTCVLNPPGVV